MGNYFRGFIKDHSNIVAPLFHMLKGDQMKKRTVLTWTPATEQAFENLRTMISNCPLLYFVDSTSPIILRTDASDYGIGGVLFQTINSPLPSLANLLPTFNFGGPSFRRRLSQFSTVTKFSTTYYAPGNLLLKLITVT
jgi:RNase H-like domain found in reverse transcriptase